MWLYIERAFKASLTVNITTHKEFSLIFLKYLKSSHKTLAWKIWNKRNICIFSVHHEYKRMIQKISDMKPR